MYFPGQRFKVWCLAFLLSQSLVSGESLRLATYNLNNYLAMDRHVEGAWRKAYPKPESEKTVIRHVIRKAMPDILAVQEIGTLAFLKELQADLAQEGFDYPHAVHMQGEDAVRHLAVLSKVAPIEIIRHRDLASGAVAEEVVARGGGRGGGNAGRWQGRW